MTLEPSLDVEYPSRMHTHHDEGDTEAFLERAAEQLLQASRDQDSKALEAALSGALYEKLYDVALRIGQQFYGPTKAQSYLGPEDIAQDTMIKLLKNPPGMREADSARSVLVTLMGWVKRVAQTTAIDHKRHNKRLSKMQSTPGA
ncbi:hypothetical protein KAI87_01890, partial [Myxococcota bacterium]|nr:hypothetical protein [Myxococcota bacterium]